MLFLEPGQVVGEDGDNVRGIKGKSKQAGQPPIMRPMPLWTRNIWSMLDVKSCELLYKVKSIL